MKAFETGREIKIGETFTLGELWDGDFGNVEDILKSGCVSPDEENVVAFDIIEENGIESIVKVTDIY